MLNNSNLTIQEAVNYSGKSISTLYRYIRSGKLPHKKAIIDDKEMIIIEKDQLIRVFKISNNQVIINSMSNDNHDNQVTINSMSNDNQMIINDNMRKVLEEFFESKQSQLMKPLEEQSIFVAGKLTQENQFLKQRLETVLQENDLLREQIKALPLPAELENKDNMILILEKEKENILSKIETIEKEKEKQNTRHITEQQKQIQELEEKEQKIKNIEELYKQKLEQAKIQAEEREKQIAEAWRKELEDAKKPWWKFW
ncbi:MAG: helix-turn-helix domain-containing protein [Candidatus Eremiobacterota bacterium]